MLLDKIKYIDMVRNITQKTTNHSPHLPILQIPCCHLLFNHTTDDFMALFDSHFVTLSRSLLLWLSRSLNSEIAQTISKTCCLW